jgi:hypothetical protein
LRDLLFSLFYTMLASFTPVFKQRDGQKVSGTGLSTGMFWKVQQSIAKQS